MTKLTHPESEQTVDVAPAQVHVYVSQGWVDKADKAATDEPPKK